MPGSVLYRVIGMLFVPLNDQIVALSLYRIVGKLNVPLIAQLARALANVLGIDHVALELAGHVDLAPHAPSEANVDLDAPILLDGWRIDGGAGAY